MTLASYSYPLLVLYLSWTSCGAAQELGQRHADARRKRERRTCFVRSIISRPYAVTLIEIGRHGSLPTVAPVNPYTELALT